LPATVGGQVRRMTPPGSVIPRVTPTATDRGPDHHRTVGSLTVIPPGPTAANQTALNGMPSQPELARPYWSGLSGRLAVIISPNSRLPVRVLPGAPTSRR